MPLLASLATIPAEITLLSFTKENKTEYNSQLFHIALIKRKNIQYLEPSIVKSKGYDDDEDDDDDDDDDDNNDDHEGEDIWQVLNSDSFLIMKIINTVNSRLADTPIIRTAAKSPAKTSCRRLTEINSRYYGLSLMRTPPRGPYSVRYKGMS